MVYYLFMRGQKNKIICLLVRVIVPLLGRKWYEYFPIVFEFDPISNDFYPSISDSEYSISLTDLYPNAQKLHFYDVDIHYNLIRQKLTLYISDSIFEHKYENKYGISDIHPYSIHFHPYMQLLNSIRSAPV